MGAQRRLRFWVSLTLWRNVENGWFGTTGSDEEVRRGHRLCHSYAYSVDDRAKWNGSTPDTSGRTLFNARTRRLMQGRERVFNHFQFFLGGHRITHLEAVGSSVIGMLETVPGVQA